MARRIRFTDLPVIAKAFYNKFLPLVEQKIFLSLDPVQSSKLYYKGLKIVAGKDMKIELSTNTFGFRTVETDHNYFDVKVENPTGYKIPKISFIFRTPTIEYNFSPSSIFVSLVVRGEFFMYFTEGLDFIWLVISNAD
jgi:hypothetical protein